MNRAVYDWEEVCREEERERIEDSMQGAVENEDWDLAWDWFTCMEMSGLYRWQALDETYEYLSAAELMSED